MPGECATASEEAAGPVRSAPAEAPTPDLIGGRMRP